jgi:aminoglycoside 6'-N-acetyltransferase
LEIGFRPLRRDDFGLLARWLAEPAVARWWNHETTPEALERDFGPSVDGRDPTEMFLAMSGDRPFGFIQRYRIAAEPEYAAELSRVCPVAPGALSIDYFVGEPDMRGRGLAAGLIAAMVARAWDAYPDADGIVVPVAAGNIASWRALERAGFVRIADGELEPDNPIDPRDHVIYAIRRPAG